MKILVLAPHPFFSHRGTPIAVRALIEVLAGEGHGITVLTYHEGEDVAIPGCRIRRIPRLPGVKNIPPAFSLKKVICDVVMFFRCRAILRSEQFDVIHAVEESSFIALAMKRRFRVPYVYDMDSSLAQQMVEKYPPLRWVQGLLERCEKRAVAESTGVLAVCRALADRALQHSPDHLVEKVEDVSLLAGTSEGGERLAEAIGAGGPIVMYVGNLEGYQGIDLLIEAFAGALARMPHAQLVIIGGTDDHIQAYRRLCSRRGIERSAHFLGPRPVSELGRLLAQAEILVSPRIRGLNTAMKVYSYMDSGRPVLATRLPTHTQILDDQVALLVEPEPESMAGGIIRLLEDVDLGRRLAARAAERVRQEHSPEAFSRKLTQFYRCVAAQIEAEAR